ncbi:MAG: RdgB/HAM1 family non-canonical purine NTP pyrophosphatase [Firmicutes bacterium]|nr:RdgB/HAM1 family non-canonical purine NTP pyrophosphatase [Bacillota bacterium]
MSIRNVIVATKNAGKIREIRQILGEDVNVVTMTEAGFTGEINETGTTFEDNSLIKARTIHEAFKESGRFDLVISDDSGIEIDYFDKKPGVYSSRWLGEDTPYDIKNQIILDKMKDVPEEKRTARYVCAIAAILKDGTEIIVKETAEGRIAESPSGEGGFGYDPVFAFTGEPGDVLPEGLEAGMTFADISAELKHAVSHRGKALRALYKELSERSLL